MLDLATAATIAPLEALFHERLHPTLREMAIECYIVLVDDEEVAGIGKNRIAEIVMMQIDRMSLQVGGAQFYLPKGVGMRLSPRNREIGQRYNGSNKHLLAREYNLSEMRIEQIFKAWRAAEFARRQGSLDLGEED
jgi:Mor family transcriptional regulator